MKRRTQLTRLLKRDKNKCGVHLGGCGSEIASRSEATVDHIFTQSFFKDREKGVKPEDYNKDWNCQPMHLKCNNQRGGQIYGFPIFLCACHSLSIVKMAKGHILYLQYHPEKISYPVTSSKNNFVFSNPSWGQITSVWSMGSVGEGKKGITGKGHLGHAFPRLSPHEVSEFNKLEIDRVKGLAEVTVDKFNQRMDPMSMKVYFERPAEK